MRRIRRGFRGQPSAQWGRGGDFHLPGQVGWALAGHAVDDDGMLQLLEPYRGHRQRAVRHLLAAGGWRVPRRAPRATPTDHRRL